MVIVALQTQDMSFLFLYALLEHKRDFLTESSLEKKFWNIFLILVTSSQSKYEHSYSFQVYFSISLFFPEPFAVSFIFFFSLLFSSV